MKRVINDMTDISTIAVPEGFEVLQCGFDEYVSDDLDSSFMIKIPQGSKDQYINIEAEFNEAGFTDLVFNACSFHCPVLDLHKSGEAFYAVDFGAGTNEEAELLEVPIGYDFDAVSVPYRRVYQFRIHILTNNADVLVLSNLRAVVELMPQDILEGFKVMNLPDFQIGTVSVHRGEQQIIISDTANIVEDSVISFNDEIHQVERIVGNKITLASTFDGAKVLSDYDGMFFLRCPIAIGYYDQDAKVPSVVLWFTSPTPILRNTKKEQYRVFGNDVYFKESLQLASWGVRIDIIGGTPEMTQLIATYVRRFLEQNKVWINGRKFTFEWTDGAVDTEPSSYLDIQPSVMYNINMEVKEEFLWQTLIKGSANLRNVTPTQRI